MSDESLPSASQIIAGLAQTTSAGRVRSPIPVLAAGTIICGREDRNEITPLRRGILLP